MATTAPITVILRLRPHPDGMDILRSDCAEVAKLIEGEPGGLGCAYSFGEDLLISREDFADGDALLAHLAGAQRFAERTLSAADIESLEICGPEAELDKVREPLGAFSARFFVTEYAA
ncbi:MAG: hypothetical protein ACR2N6_06415 [Miltoncostaeaceae bacterium]